VLPNQTAGDGKQRRWDVTVYLTLLESYTELDHVSNNKKILLISASLIALSGSASVLAAPDQQRSSLASQQVQQQVNINNASAVEIAATLKGVGLKTANAIVAYRKANGAFKSVESIAMVKGVGSKTLAKNSARIVLE